MILERVLSSEDVFYKGVDIGCGTGYSAVALAKYALCVYGIDPSQSMLEEAMPHERITYQQGTGENLPLSEKSVEVVTFAGSLFYAKSDLLIEELKRVCVDAALIISYDFEVLIDEILAQYNIAFENAISDYDHSLNFSGRVDFVEMKVGQECLAFEVTAIELAHILLSTTQRYEAFVGKYGVSDPFSVLVRELEETETLCHLKANIYFSKYEIHVN